ncbi:DUF2155 domain-containing protein [Oceanicella actignis]|uniref:DUF2155 domain-containing protein n=1 Tax=Oceanicella actignis TaxID=1189325 RepID=A0A1M7TG64_9RHOB|nr:DUF2155 domain-containing protein [Oceanicella actignis]SET60292.1 hypothetical protein SAMN04488119_10693 [Oceanicella actignis]SHN69744.1 hypothetical protein SAMN05216200_106110 [Oceanicella actignis]
MRRALPCAAILALLAAPAPAQTPAIPGAAPPDGPAQAPADGPADGSAEGPAARAPEDGADRGPLGALFRRPPDGAAPEDGPQWFGFEDARPPEWRGVSQPGARLRLLDKMTGRVETLDLPVGARLRRGRLELVLRACRVPPEDVAAEDAFAYLEARDLREEAPRFAGWMFASSPALSAMDHARYDVWLVNCSTSSDEASSGRAWKSAAQDSASSSSVR